MKTKLLLVMSVTVLAMFLVGWGSPDGKGPEFSDNTRTNNWTWTATGPAPVMKYLGTSYTGQTTNIVFLSGTGVTNQLQFVNGILTGVLAAP